MLYSRRLIHVLIAAGIAMLSTPARAANNERALFIDGKVRTQGISMEGVRVVVYRDGAQVQLFTGDVSKVTMRLDLGHEYILAFERTGCMTKELLFDTNVPEEGLEFVPFNFPFLVTLEKQVLGSEFRYAQPVGYVRYYPEKRDFGYDTNYTLFRERREKEARTLATKNNTTEAEALTSERTELSLVNDQENAPTDRVIKNDPPSTAPDTQSPSATFTREKDTEVMGRTSFMGSGDRGQTNTPTHGTPRPVEPRPVIAPLPDGRTDELIVEPTYVARVIRITEAGHTREYRRVVHRFGDTYFFCNGSSCGEVTYSTAISDAP